MEPLKFESPSDHAFVSYVSEDAGRIRELARDLRQYGVRVWLDREDIAPGSNWRQEIQQAIRAGACFVACFSAASETRERSYMREEIALAIDEMRLRSPRQSWFIPLKIDDCEIPDLPISASFSLDDIHFIDLSQDWDNGVARLATAIRPSMKVSEELRRQAAELTRSDIDAALHLLGLAIGAEKTNFTALADRGRLLLQIGRYLEASNDLEQATSGTKSTEMRRELGRSLWLASLTDEALAAFSRCAREDDKCIPALYDFGSLLYSVGRMSEAADVFIKAYEIAPTNLNLTRAALRPLLHLRNPDRILDFLRGAMTIHDHPDLHEGLAFGLILKYKLFTLDGLLRDYREPGGIELQGAIARAQKHADEWESRAPIIEKVAESIDRSIAGEPDNPARLYRGAALYAHIYESDRAGPLVERGLKLAPSSEALHLLMAYACEYSWNKTRTGEIAEHFAAVHNPWSDPIIIEDPFPRLADDDRNPYPEIRRYALVRYSVGGVVQSVNMF